MPKKPRPPSPLPGNIAAAILIFGALVAGVWYKGDEYFTVALGDRWLGFPTLCVIRAILGLFCLPLILVFYHGSLIKACATEHGLDMGMSRGARMLTGYFGGALGVVVVRLFKLLSLPVTRYEPRLFFSKLILTLGIFYPVACIAGAVWFADARGIGKVGAKRVLWREEQMGTSEYQRLRAIYAADTERVQRSYDALTKDRAALDANDGAAVEAFNAKAAQYREVREEAARDKRKMAEYIQ